MLKLGDIILVHTKPPYGIFEIVAPIIRWITKCHWNHVAIVGEANGELWVYEAVENGFVPTTALHEYLKSSKREIKVKRPFKYYAPEEIRDRFAQLINKKYDFVSLLWYQLWYQLKRKWKGPKGDAADDKIYCSEAAAFLYPEIFPEWWKVAPVDLDKCKDLVDIYIDK